MLTSTLSHSSTVFDIALFGDSRVGKTSLMHSWAFGKFEMEYKMTTSEEIVEVDVDTNHGKITLRIHDNPNMSRETNYDGGIIMFDLTSSSSFQSCSDYYESAVRICNHVVLCGNKCDFYKRRIFREHIWSIRLPVTSYKGISVRTGQNCDAPFVYLLRKIMNNKELVIIKKQLAKLSPVELTQTSISSELVPSELVPSEPVPSGQSQEENTNASSINVLDSEIAPPELVPVVSTPPEFVPIETTPVPVQELVSSKPALVDPSLRNPFLEAVVVSSESALSEQSQEENMDASSINILDSEINPADPVSPEFIFSDKRDKIETKKENMQERIAPLPRIQPMPYSLYIFTDNSKHRDVIVKATSMYSCARKMINNYDKLESLFKFISRQNKLSIEPTEANFREMLEKYGYDYVFSLIPNSNHSQRVDFEWSFKVIPSA